VEKLGRLVDGAVCVVGVVEFEGGEVVE